MQKQSRNKFSLREDNLLRQLVSIHGKNNWDLVSEKVGNKTARQCKDRWRLFLDPNINKEPFTEAEDKLLLKKLEDLGHQWRKIVKFFLNRTDVQLKNRFNVLMRHKNRAEKLSKLQQDTENPTPSIKNDSVNDDKSSKIPVPPQESIFDCNEEFFDTTFDDLF